MKKKKKSVVLQSSFQRYQSQSIKYNNSKSIKTIRQSGLPFKIILHECYKNKLTYNYWYSYWYLLIDQIFFNPRTLYHCPVSDMSGIDAVVNGMICAHAENYDR